MYAVVDTGGKQAKVEKDAVIAVERIKADVGGKITLPVLFLADGEKILATPDELAGVTVSAEVLEHFKGDKQMVFKLKKRKGYKRTKGHRQTLTAVRILDITVGEAPAKVAKPAKATEVKAPEKKAAAPAKEETPKEKPAREKPAKPEPAEAAAEPAKQAPAAKPAEVAQCEAVKSDGTRCANKAKEGSKYCGVHAKKYEG